MIRFIYNLLWPIGLLLFLPGYIVKMVRRGGYREKFGQRLGWYDVDLPKRLSTLETTWLHAVSVGEVAVALKLAPQLRMREPDLRCVLTSTTTTGFRFASRNAPDWIEVMYTPLDFWPIMRRAFDVICPKRIILVEAEIWPNLVSLARRRGIPVALVNARLSKHSERRFHLFRFAVEPTFHLLDLVCVQEPEDVERWTALGVEKRRIHCVGSIKYDPADAVIDSVKTDAFRRELKIDNNQPVILAGSTHPGEEEIVGGIFSDLRREFPGLVMMIAPRHMERAHDIRKRLERFSLRTILRSELRGNDPSECVVLDSTGELRDWYGVATLVFIGKSMTVRGGQNPVEAVLADKPVVFGPHMENFAALARDLVTHDGAVQVETPDALLTAMRDLLRDGEKRSRLVTNAKSVLAAHHGATARTADLLAGLRSRLPTAAPG